MLYTDPARYLAYASLAPRLALAMEYLTKTDLAALPAGEYALDGANVFVRVMEYETTPKHTRAFEAHRDYFDLHYVARGEENVYILPRESLTPLAPYNQAGDDWRYADVPADTVVHLGPGQLVLLAPEEAHSPCCRVGDPCVVKKVVVKIKARA